VLTEATGRFAAAIKPRGDLTAHVDHLAFGVDAQSGACVVHDRRGPSGVKRGVGNLVHRAGFAEILVNAAIDKGIIARHGFLETRWRHGHSLIFHDDLLGEIANLLAPKKKPAAMST
jgi:hypothetical protein